MRGSRLECSYMEDTFKYNHCYMCVVYSTLLCIQWTNLSPYLKHLVFLDVQKCTKYVKSRGSKITHFVYILLLKFISNTMFWKWDAQTTSLSSTHYYICTGSGRKEKKVQRALYQYVYSQARLPIFPCACALCFTQLCIQCM